MKASGLLGYLVCSASVAMTGCFLPGQVLKATPGGQELGQARDSGRTEVAESSRRPPPSTSASPRRTPEPPPEAQQPAPSSPQAHEPALAVATPTEPALAVATPTEPALAVATPAEPALAVATPTEPAPLVPPPDTTEVSPPPEAPPLSVYAYRETAHGSFHQAYLTPSWNSHNLQFLAIDGNRYPYSIILSYVSDQSNESLLSLTEDGSLLIALDEHFELEIAVYPPDAPGHEIYDPFDIVIVNRESRIVHRESIAKRTKRYKIVR